MMPEHLDYCVTAGCDREPVGWWKMSDDLIVAMCEKHHPEHAGHPFYTCPGCGVETRDPHACPADQGGPKLPEGWSAHVSIRGFRYLLSEDVYQNEVSVQESSVIPHLWVGCKTATRMHLNQEQARALAHILLHFADHGSLDGLRGGDDV